MTKECPNARSLKREQVAATFVLSASCFLRHSCFVILGQPASSGADGLERVLAGDERFGATVIVELNRDQAIAGDSTDFDDLADAVTRMTGRHADGEAARGRRLT